MNFISLLENFTRERHVLRGEGLLVKGLLHPASNVITQ